MDNITFAAAMRQEAEKWIGTVPVPMTLCLQIADRIEASPDPVCEGLNMSNVEYAAAIRKESNKWIGTVPVSIPLWLLFADRIEASPDPKGTEPYKEIKL